jgi:AcrR family transcriptional regulator
MATTARKQGRPAVSQPGRLDDARARMYRELVFESAECVFGQSGFEHATMQDIAGEAGISLKTLYATFAGKHELYEEIQKVRGQAFVERVAAASDPEATPLDRLAQSVRAYVDFLFEHRDWLRIHLQTRVSWGLRPNKGYAADYWVEGLSPFASILAEGAQSGVFYEADAMPTAALVQSIMQVKISQAVSGNQIDAGQTADEIMLQLRRLLCRSQSR